MQPVEPKVLLQRHPAARVEVVYRGQVALVVRLAALRQVLQAGRLLVAVDALGQDVGEELVRLEGEERGVRVRVGEAGGEHVDAVVVVVDGVALVLLGGAAEAGLRGPAVEGGDVVDEEVAGAEGVELLTLGSVLATVG